MLYTIHGLQQDKLIEIGLTNDDALILKVLRDRYSSMKMEYKIVDNQRYIWVDYGSVSDDIPILVKPGKNGKPSKSNLMSKIKRYEELGLISRKTFYEKNGEKGTYAYICLTKNFDNLTEYEKATSNTIEKIPYPKFRQGVSKNRIGGIQNLDNKEYNINDSNISDNTSSLLKCLHKKEIFSIDDDVKESNLTNIKEKEDDTNVEVITKKPSKKDLVNFSKADIEYINLYRASFKAKYGAILHEYFTKELFILKGKEILNYYLEHYQKILDSSKKDIKKVAEYFYTTVKNEIPVPTSFETKLDKPANMINYEQREYDDDYFNSLYDNVTFIKTNKKE